MIRMRDIKLKKKITYVIILVLLIPFSIIAYFSYNYLFQQYEKDIYTSSLVISNHYKNQITDEMEGIENFIVSVANNYYLNSFLGWEYKDDYYSLTTYRDIERYVISSLTINSYLFDDIQIYYFNYSIPEKWPVFHKIDHLEKSYLERFGLKSRDAEEMVSSTMNLATELFYENDRLVFVKPIISQIDYTCLGFIKITVNNENLYDPLSVHKNDYIKMVVTTKDNTLIYDPRHSAEIGTINEELNPMNALIMNNNLIIEDPFDNNNLKLVTYISRKVILTEMNKAVKSLIISLSIGALVLVIIIYFIIDLFLKRMNRLAKAMVEFSEGNFDVLIDDTSEDEIGTIIHTFNDMTKDIKLLNQSIADKERKRREADMKALRAQINPHFIYNTLEIFRTRADKHDDYILSSSLHSMGKMLRYSTNWSENSTLGEEINHIRDYVKLYTASCKDQVNLFFQGQENLLDSIVPKMILQPIIENSLEHGYKAGKTMNIQVNYSLDTEFLEIEIYDDGQGMNTAKLQQVRQSLIPDGEEVGGTSNSIALRNINGRIQIHYGEEYGMSIDSEEELFTVVRIKVPYRPIQ